MNEVFRQEKKYLMTVTDMANLAHLLEAVMMEDPHNGAEGYRIRSLYFDSLDNEDYNDKLEGLELRRKIRLRCYDPNSDFAMLEMKQKEGDFQKKRSIRLKREEAIRLTHGDYSPLLLYSDPFAAECYGLMQYKCYRPKSIVEYQRKAYIAKENRIRITLDSKLIATESSFDIFATVLPQYPVLHPFQGILEVKYNGFLLSYIKDLVNTANRSPISTSKYCLSRSAGLHYQN